MGLGMVPFEGALVCSYRPYVVTFSTSLRVSDIAAFVLQHDTSSHPTSSIPKISPCPPEVDEWALCCEERKCWPNCPCN